MWATDTPKITDWLSAGTGIAMLLLTIFSVVGVSLYASGFQIRARATMDSNNVVHVRILNWGRLAGEVESVDVVVRHRAWIRALRKLLRRKSIEVSVARAKTKDQRTLKPAMIAHWWVKVDLGRERKLPARSNWLSKSGTGVRKPVRDELVVRIAGAFGRPTYRKITPLTGHFADLPAGLDLV